MNSALDRKRDMRKILLLMLLSVSSASIATEYGKICIGPIAEADAYQISVNESKKYGLAELVQICINEVSITSQNKVKIFHSNNKIQELLINFVPGKNELACISYDKGNKKWVSNWGSMDEEHCEF